MASNASDILVQTLIDPGVDLVFGLPGDGTNGIVEALRRRRDDNRFIQARHEKAAAFMVVVYAKVTESSRLPGDDWTRRHHRPC